MDFFIDWLSAHQNHLEGGLPIVTKTINTITDPDTAELIKCYTTNKKIEGSFSSSISVRCDGYNVFVSGNPSRWNRPDNLFGFTTFDECIRVYNIILSGLGLPAFTKNTGFKDYQKREGSSVDFVPNGTVFTRIDLTENLETGKNNPDSVIRGLSMHSAGRHKPHLYTNGKTVEWGGGSTLTTTKVYNKSHELSIHALPKAKRMYGEDSKVVQYILKLIEYCDSVGLVRNEKCFKNDFLKRKNLNLYGKINEKEFIPYLKDIENILGKLEMNTSDYNRISEQLLKAGAVDTERQANYTDSIAHQWLHGKPIKLKKSQLSQHKARLKRIGIDISIPYDASKQMPQIKNERVVSIKKTLPPEWYDMPKVAHLRVA